MPRKGYKGITVDETTYSAVAEIAQKLDKTIPETIKFLINEAIMTSHDAPQDVQCRTVQKNGSSQSRTVIWDEDVEWPEKCDPLETCGKCPLKYLCWVRKLMLGDEKITAKFVKLVQATIADNNSKKKSFR